MNIADLLTKLRDEQKLEPGRIELLLDLHEKRLFSVYSEIRFLLYVGILMVIAGAGLTIKQHFTNLGDIAIISALAFCCMAAFIYCFIKGNSFTKDEVASPNIAFDYILFFGCALFSMDIAYIETQFHLLGDGWKHYLLISVIIFFFLSYRFDNRLVLSLALSTLAAWFGFTLSDYRFSLAEYYRLYAMAYGLSVICAGVLLYRLAVKKHFFDIYLNFGVHFLCIALLSGVAQCKFLSIYFPVLLLACVALAYYSIKVRKLLYIFYAVIYGYIGISIVIVHQIGPQGGILFMSSYFILTSLLVIGLIFKISNMFREEK
jgi:hypothetical protein